MLACTFFGHHDCPDTLMPQLEAAITLCIRDGVSLFYVGNHGHFDALVLSALQRMQRIFPEIQYYIVLAYLPTGATSSDVHSLFPEGIENAPRRFAISWRNRWMLARSDYVISYVAHSWGNASQLLALARRQGKTVLNLFDAMK